MKPEERYPHLAIEAAVMADKDKAQRIAYIYRDRFIAHQRADEILNEIEMLYQLEDALRPQGRLLVGQPLMGKSTLLEEFQIRHPAEDNPGGNAAIVPVVYVQYPESAKEGIYQEVLAKLNAQLSRNTKPADLRRSVVDLLRQVGARILLIDEVHNLLEGSANSQRKGLNSIKYLMNELRRPVIVAGTIEAYNALRTDPQINSRLRAMPLQRFMDDNKFQDLLQCFELLLPLRKPSNLADPHLSSIIFKNTMGIVGNVSDLLNRAAEFAIHEDVECITSEMIEENRWGSLTDSEIKEMLR